MRWGRLLTSVAVLLAVAAVSSVVFDQFLRDDVRPGTTRNRAAPQRGPVAAVTNDDNGGEVVVGADQQVVVRLQGSPDAPWGVPRATADALALVSSSEELDGSVTATFVPVETSPSVVVRAERGGVPAERFEVSIRVVR